MSTTTEQEEELLIISDDWDDILDMDLALEEVKSVDSDIISFGDESSEEENVEITLEDESSSIDLDLWELSLDIEDNNELNLDFDLGGETSEMTVEKMLWEKEANKSTTEAEDNSDDLFDFWLDDDTTDEVSLEAIAEENEVVVESNDDILENFSLETDEVEWELPEAEENEVELELPEVELPEVELAAEELELPEVTEVELELPEVSEVETDLTEVEESISLEVEDEKSELLNDTAIIGAWVIAAWVATTSKDGSSASDDSSTWDDAATGDDDVDAILDATIARLNARKEKIEAVKEDTIESIAKLNEEIKSLQTEVKEHKAEAKEFDKETAKIGETVDGLEKMKMNKK